MIGRTTINLVTRLFKTGGKLNDPPAKPGAYLVSASLFIRHRDMDAFSTTVKVEPL
jgi:hypothetical protein